MQAFRDRETGAAYQATILDGDDGIVGAGDFGDQGNVKRFDKAHVDHRGVEPFAGSQGGCSTVPNASSAIRLPVGERPLDRRRISPRPQGNADISLRGTTPAPAPRG